MQLLIYGFDFCCEDKRGTAQACFRKRCSTESLDISSEREFTAGCSCCVASLIVLLFASAMPCQRKLHAVTSCRFIAMHFTLPDMRMMADQPYYCAKEHGAKLLSIMGL